MSIGEIIEIAAVIIWIFPAVRNYRTELRVYFIIFAIASPIAQLLYEFTGFYAMYTFTFCRLLQLTNLIGWNKSLFKNKAVIILATATIILGILIPEKPSIMIVLFSFGTLFIFLKKLLNSLFNNSNLDIYLLLLILYELLLITPNFILTIGIEGALELFYITGVFQFLPAIIFSIFPYGSDKLKITLKY